MRRWSTTSERCSAEAGRARGGVARVEMGYNYEELAEVLGKPTPDAARKAAQRVLVRLAEEMKRGAQ